MSNLPYYPRYPRDFFEGTAGLPFEVKAAYSLVLDLIYMMGERGLPDDPHFISGHLGMSVRKWNGIKKALLDAGKVYLSDGIISNVRADKEKIIQSKYRDKQRENALGRSKNKDLEEPPRSHTDTDTEEKEEPNGSSKKRRSRLPEDWRLPKEWGEYALAKGIDEVSVRREAVQFADHHRSKGNLMVDWKAAWRTWVRNSIKFRDERYGGRVQPRPGYVDAGAFGQIPEVC